MRVTSRPITGRVRILPVRHFAVRSSQITNPHHSLLRQMAAQKPKKQQYNLKNTHKYRRRGKVYNMVPTSKLDKTD